MQQRPLTPPPPHTSACGGTCWSVTTPMPARRARRLAGASSEGATGPAGGDSAGPGPAEGDATLPDDEAVALEAARAEPRDAARPAPGRPLLTRADCTRSTPLLVITIPPLPPPWSKGLDEASPPPAASGDPVEGTPRARSLRSRAAAVISPRVRSAAAAGSAYTKPMECATSS